MLKSIVRALKALGLVMILSGLTWLAGSTHSMAIAAVGKAVITGTSEAGNVTGDVTLVETEAGLTIEAVLDNVPSGQHGFHIHEFGSCANAGNAAGGHYNPKGVKHGMLVVDGFEAAHAGDLGNISAAETGTASYRETLPGLTLTGGTYPVAGRAVIVHENEDDFGQPTGNAGGRLGCGAIVISPDESA